MFDERQFGCKLTKMTFHDLIMSKMVNMNFRFKFNSEWRIFENQDRTRDEKPICECKKCKKSLEI